MKQTPWTKIYERAANRNTIEIPEETIKAMQDSVSDPTGLKPFMRTQIEQGKYLSNKLTKSEQKNKKQFIIGIIVNIACMFVGYLLGKFF